MHVLNAPLAGGNISRNRIVNGYFEKQYFDGELLDSKSEIHKRIKLINLFSYQNYPSLLKTEIYFNKSCYWYRQAAHPKIQPSRMFRKEDFRDIGNALKYFEKEGFVHGDLNRKNIVFTKEGFKIVDLEPSLYQIKNNTAQYMVTSPYFYSKDIANNRITIATDKIGFYFFVLRTLKKISSLDVVKLSKNHFCILQYLCMDENVFVLKSYDEILNLAFRFKKTKQQR